MRRRPNSGQFLLIGRRVSALVAACVALVSSVHAAVASDVYSADLYTPITAAATSVVLSIVDILLVSGEGRQK